MHKQSNTLIEQSPAMLWLLTKFGKSIIIGNTYHSFFGEHNHFLQQVFVTSMSKLFNRQKTHCINVHTEHTYTLTCNREAFCCAASGTESNNINNKLMIAQYCIVEPMVVRPDNILQLIHRV